MRTQPGGAMTRLSGRKQPNCKWSEIDSLIYNRVFASHARKIAIPSPNMASPPPLRSAWSIILTYAAALLPRPSPPKHPALNPPRSDICLSILAHAIMATCKFRHMCLICSRRHPKVACKANKPSSQGSKEQKMPPSKQ